MFGFKKTAGNMRGALERFRGRFGGMSRRKDAEIKSEDANVQPKARFGGGGFLNRMRKMQKPEQAPTKGPEPTKRMEE